MKTKSILIWSLLLVAVILYLFSLQGGKKAAPSAGQGPLECTISFPVPGIPWTFEGTSKYNGKQLRMEGQVVPNNDSLDPVDLLVIYDDGSMYAYGTATPVTDPSNVGWYDVSKTDDGMMIITREVTDFMGHMDKGEKATGATCRNVAAIDPSEFELPEDAMVKNIPPGGMYQYY